MTGVDALKSRTDDLANRYVSAEQRATLTNYPW